MAATIADVARLAQVSVATVSRALRGLPNVAPETRARVVAAAEQLQYVVDPHASRLAAGQPRTIGLVLPKIGQWYYARLFATVNDELALLGYDVLPFALTDPATRGRFLERAPFRKRVDALIVVDVPMTDEQLAFLAGVNVPIVTVGLRTTAFPSLTVDNVRGARLATEHLVGLGHERIGLLGGTRDEAFAFHVPLDRQHGFEQALQARGLALHEDLVVPAQLSMSGGAEAMQEVLQHDHRPTAVVAMSDEMAIGAMQVARDLGLRLPEEMSVVGFDDHEVSEFVGLTTVRQDVPAQGRAAVAWTLEALAGEERDHHEVLPTRLIVRRSTAAPHDARPAPRRHVG